MVREEERKDRVKEAKGKREKKEKGKKVTVFKPITL